MSLVELSQADIARCINEARAEVGLPPAYDTPLPPGFYPRRTGMQIRQTCDYFAVSQEYVTTPSGETRAVLTWISPTGEKRCYTEKVVR